MLKEHRIPQSREAIGAEAATNVDGSVFPPEVEPEQTFQARLTAFWVNLISRRVLQQNFIRAKIPATKQIYRVKSELLTLLE